MRMVVVRHGHAVPKRTWTGVDADRPLTGRGRRQAADLLELVGRHPTRMFTSPALRCRQTIEPAAKQCRLDPEVVEALAVDAGPAAAEMMRDLAAEESGRATVVLCTHREVIVESLPVLAKEAGVDLGHRLPGAKGGAWELFFRAGRLDLVEYRRPIS